MRTLRNNKGLKYECLYSPGINTEMFKSSQQFGMSQTSKIVWLFGFASLDYWVRCSNGLFSWHKTQQIELRWWVRCYPRGAYRSSITTRGSLLSRRARGSSSTNFTRATSGSSLSTVTLGSLLATRSGRSSWARVSLWSDILQHAFQLSVLHEFPTYSERIDCRGGTVDWCFAKY